jgi:glycosyltransferase involved in cell wall biosynthesis
MKIAMIGQKGVGTGPRAGGIERHVAEIVPRLADMGHDIFVYARKKYHPNKEKTFEGSRLVFIPTLYSKNLEAIIHTFFSTLHALFGRFDVIHYHGVGPATLAWIPRIFSRNTTVIVTFHSQDQFHQKWGMFARKYLAIAERASVVFPHYCICVSHAIQIYCRETFNRECVYIPNGAEIKEVHGSQELDQFGLESKQYILNVGRIVPQKGLQFLIEAFKRIKTDKQLVVVGSAGFSDEYMSTLMNLAKGDNRVHFLGFQSGDTLDQLYANAYLYVHPSEYEGLPVVILEAMSFGLAPLVSDIPANVEAIHHAGVTFESANVDDLEKKLRDLIAQPKEVEHRAEESQAIIEVHFNWDKISEHIESVYVSARH